MTVIICEIHGATGATLISPDILADFLNQKQSFLEEYHQIKVSLFEDVNAATYCWLSSDEIKQVGIPTGKILSWDEFSSYKELSLEPVCGKCFKNWINRNS